MRNIPIAPVHRILKNADVMMRVSDSAAEGLVTALEVKADKVARQAVEFAAFAGRKTVRAEDIELANRILSR